MFYYAVYLQLSVFFNLNSLFISIIIPAYNAGAYIDNAIQSCLSQSLDDYEIIVIDDGSFDDTLQRANFYKNEKYRVSVFTQSNQGVSAARNLGISKALGHFICFLDADDTLNKLLVEKAYVEYQRNNALECIVFGHRQTTVTGNTYEDAFLKAKSLKGAGAFLLAEKFPTIWGKLFKRSLLIVHNIQCYESNTLEDMFFTLEFFLINPVLHFSDYSAYNYEYNQQSLSRKIDINLLKKRQEIVNHYYKKLFQNSGEFISFFLARVLKQIFLAAGSTMKVEHKYKAFELSLQYSKQFVKQIRIDINVSSNWGIAKIITWKKVSMAFMLFIIISKLPDRIAFYIIKWIGGRVDKW